MKCTTMCRTNRVLPALALPGLLLLVHGAARAQTAPAKLTVMVPMRDGVRLATDVYLPSGDGPWPVALTRTPYGKGNVGDTGIPLSRFVNSGIALVAQDVRGRFASEGKAWPYVDDGWGALQDGVDTVAWIRQQPWANGKIATFGGSYLGDVQYFLAGAGPEGIVGQYVSVGTFSPYHGGFYQNGVFLKGDIEGWLRPNRWPADVLTLFRQHPSYDDFWRGMDLGTRLEKVRWPIVHEGGWYDVNIQNYLDAFMQLQEKGGEGARGRQRLLIGPWTHAEVFSNRFGRRAGALTFPANAGFPPGASDRFGWLGFWLTGQPRIPADEPIVRYYVMGDVSDAQAPGNVWRTADHWPPPSRPLRLYFGPDGVLAPQPPATATTLEYDYNPASPVPTRGGSFIAQGPQDQRPVESRPDVLVFSTQPLTEAIEVTGRIWVRLYAASSARDTDFTAKLTDVYPDGRSMLLRDGIVRARYRTSLSEPTPIVPGERYAYDIDLWSTSIVFNKGHRIRVAISSSNSPRFEPNPNTFPDRDVPAVVAHQTITLGGAEASYILLPEVLGGGRP
jgi:predicted acyl esterase